jgi:membrane protein DedA with SNARE-associated domain
MDPASVLPDFVARAPLPCSFLFLMVFGFTTPICEELAVALVGMTLKATGTPFLIALALALPALLIQNTGLFFFARLFGARIVRHRLLRWLIKPRILEEAELFFSKRGPRMLFSSRFVVGLRSAAILGAGFLRMSWPKFIAYESLAAAITTPAWLFVGYSLGAQLDEKAGQFEKLVGLLGPAAILVAAFLIWMSVRSDKARLVSETQAP